MKDIIECLRAKPKNEENYLLKDHIKETILRAIQLRDFINQNKFTFTHKFDDEFFINLIIACFLHDLGKINWSFQLTVYDKEEKKYDHENKRYENNELNQLYEFFKGFRDINVKDHEIISLIYSLIFLGNDDEDKKIRTAILLHHYNEFYTNEMPHILNIFNAYPDLKKYLEFLISNKDKIKNLLTELINYIFSDNNFLESIGDNLKKNLNSNLNEIEKFKEHVDKGFNLSTKLKLFVPSDKEDEKLLEFFVFLGALRRCDYSASGQIYIEAVRDLNKEIYADIKNKIEEKINKENGYFWQKEILQKHDSKSLVLIAPTGSGKTEFSLLWARNRGKKMIYTLPLRVALNDLYQRFIGNEDEKGYFNEDFLRILHSTSFIEYLKEKNAEKLYIDDKILTAKLFSSPLILTTPDQVFLTCLKYYGFDKLISVYPFSAVILDEIQTYTSEMAAIIIKTLQIIQKLNGNILVMTATLPPYFKEFLNENNGFKILDLKDETLKNNVKNYLLKRHRLCLLETGLFVYGKTNHRDTTMLKINEKGMDEVIKIMKNNEEKNILIIVNNVGKSIELFKKLENLSESSIKNKKIYLLHSRLLEGEKSKRIDEIKKNLKNKNEKTILVATQIVEASVNVDFDILITEASPIDSQIQRWGRIHRNRGNENYNETTPNIFIFTSIDRGTSAIYDKRVVEKTIEVLRKYQNQVLDYEKEREIIEEVFDSQIENQTLKDVFIREIKNNLEWLKYVSIEKRSEAQRIFRRIAGIQVFVPQIMIENGGEIEKAFGEILKNKENWKLPWESGKGESIVEKVKSQINDEEVKKKVNKWRLLEIIYSYSFNLPIFSFEKHKYNILEKEDFKGFFILKTEAMDKEVFDEIRKYGVNKIGNKINIDNEEIKFEDIVI